MNDDEDTDEDEEDDINYFKDSSDEKSGENQHNQTNEILSTGKFNLHEKRRYKINDLQQVRLSNDASQNKYLKIEQEHNPFPIAKQEHIFEEISPRSPRNPQVNLN